MEKTMRLKRHTTQSCKEIGRIAFVVLVSVCLLLSCSSRNTTEQTRATSTPSAGETATTVLSAPPSPSSTQPSAAATNTSVPIPTHTNTPVATASPSPMFTATPEPTYTPTPTTTWVIAALVYQGIDIVLVGPAGEIVKKVAVSSTPFTVRWSPDRCHLQVAVVGEKIRLFEVDLESGIEQELFAAKQDPNGEWRTAPDMSPDGQWVVYSVWSGELKPFGGAEFQDVEVVAVNDQTKRFRLTERGGAGVYDGVWSPDGQRLAYSDYDEAGNSQLYLSRPDGSDRRQLTHFTTSELRVEGIDWSPDGRRLEFSVSDRDGSLQGIWVIGSDGSNPHALTLEDGKPVRGSGLWWSTGSRTLVVHVWGYESVDGLYWFNLDTGTVDHVFYDVKAPSKHIAFPFLISDVQTIGFLGGDYNFYSYNLTDGTYKLWLDKFTLFPEYKNSKEGYPRLQQVDSIPGGPVDISQCPSK